MTLPTLPRKLVKKDNSNNMSVHILLCCVTLFPKFSNSSKSTIKIININFNNIRLLTEAKSTTCPAVVSESSLTLPACSPYLTQNNRRCLQSLTLSYLCPTVLLVSCPASLIMDRAPRSRSLNT